MKRKKKYSFWTKLDPTEGMFAIVIVLAGVAGFFLALTAVVPVSRFEVGRLIVGIAAIFFAASYFYHTAKIVRRREK